MSSTLPKEIKSTFDAFHRRPDGTYPCHRCQKSFPRKEIHVDHIVPEWKGGSTTLSNLQPLCIPCHKAKTGREATERARLNRRRAGRPVLLVNLAVGGAFCWVAWRLWFGQVDALPGDAKRAVLAALVAAVTYAMFAFVRAWWRMGGQGEPTGADVTVTTSSLPPQDHLAKRMTLACREIMGNQGEISVAPGVDGTYSIAYPGTGFADHDEDKVAELADKIAKKTGQRFNLEVDGTRDEISATPRKSLPTKVAHPGFATWANRPWHRIPIADDIWLDFMITAHILIQGATGSGKTSVQRCVVEALIDSASRGECKVILIDPKRVEFTGYRGLENVTVATAPEQIWHQVLDIRAEMIDRYDRADRGERAIEDNEPLVVVIDEYEFYTMAMENLRATGEGEFKRVTGERYPKPVGAMREMLIMARTCKIHFVIGTQRADAEYFGGRARDQLEGRIGCGRLTAVGSEICFDSRRYGRDIPKTVKGRITAQVLDGEPVEAQAYWLPVPPPRSA